MKGTFTIIKTKVLATVLTVVALLAGQQAFATIDGSIAFQGHAVTSNNSTLSEFKIEGLSGVSQTDLPGSSYNFSGQPVNCGPYYVSITGTLNFPFLNNYSDIQTGSEVTIVITHDTNYWFYDATVKNSSDEAISGCSASASSDHTSITVTIPSGTTFGAIIVDYVPNEPFNSSNTEISGLEDEYLYLGSPIEPVPTVTYNGTVLTEDTDYTLFYWGTNRLGEAQITVTGTGNYAGDIRKSYTIRNIAPSDFNSLGNNSYEIATTDDLDNLAVLVNVANNDCEGLTFKQTADIAYMYTTAWNTISGGETNFTAIGGDKNFCGTFDGQNHTISGIRINRQAYYNGLFGRVGGNATIENIILKNSSIRAEWYCGGIVGYADVNNAENEHVLITNCHVEEDVHISPIDGYNQNFGGIAGFIHNGVTISGCTCAATIDDSEGRSVGGIVGWCYFGGIVMDCLFTGEVKGKTECGAIAGSYNNPTLTNNYYTRLTARGVGKTDSSLGEDVDGARHAKTYNDFKDVPDAIGENVLRVYGNVAYLLTAHQNGLFYIDTYYYPALDLYDNEDNTHAIGLYVGRKDDVTLQGRTLYKDGSWNTLCLPFNVSTTSGPLAGDGVKAMTLKTSTSGFSNGTLTLNFTSASTIPAGTPFIIKWNNTGGTLTDPVFTGVTISTDRHNATVTDVLTFTGTYSPVSIGNEGDNTILYLGAGSTLYWPNGTMTIGCQRAYFQLLGDLTAGDPTSTIKSFVLNFDEETGIRTTNLTNLTNGADAWYDLSGRKLEGKPTQKGLYIYGNKKVIIK